MKCIKCPLVRDTSCITDDCEEYDYECWVDGRVPDGNGCHRTDKWILAQDAKVFEDAYWQAEAEAMGRYIREQEESQCLKS